MMAKLHPAWNRLAADYDRLWNHCDDESAETEFQDLQKKGNDIPDLGATEALDYNQRLLAKWQDHVFMPYGLTNTA